MIYCMWTGVLVLRIILCFVANLSKKYRHLLHCTVLALNSYFPGSMESKSKKINVRVEELKLNPVIALAAGK